MTYTLKNCRNGEEACYPTTVTVEDLGESLRFTFTGEHSSYYCPHPGYNGIHSDGDIFEILIGTDPERKSYYEIQISPESDFFLARMDYGGADENGIPRLTPHFVEDCFLRGGAVKTETGFTATVEFDKKDVFTGEGELYFNCYRIETDGGEMDKHLFALFPTMRPKFHAPEHYRFLKDYATKK